MAMRVFLLITTRFDEAPNIAWGKKLEQGGAHVVYGMERLKTHVRLTMTVKQESGGIKRYVHVGTGNYRTGTARLDGDSGNTSCNWQLGEGASRLFNELTGTIPAPEYEPLFVAPHNMRERFTSLIRQEADNCKAGKSCRSQIVEGWARKLKNTEIEAYSAGIEQHGLKPLAVKATNRGWSGY